tara:strand:+ start:2384 stop:2551 length:168 start_codon:yes stop_codon:yes gene_type:complete
MSDDKELARLHVRMEKLSKELKETKAKYGIAKAKVNELLFMLQMTNAYTPEDSIH